LDACVIGVSTDTVETLRRFRDTHGVQFHFGSDTDKSVTKTYGVRRRFPWPSTKRVTYIIDRDDVIQAVFRHEVAVGGHVSDVLDFLGWLR
jgi:peroxiredoxin Q/BCP